jgi:hypothetical protein
MNTAFVGLNTVWKSGMRYRHNTKINSLKKKQAISNLSIKSLTLFSHYALRVRFESLNNRRAFI